MSITLTVTAAEHVKKFLAKQGKGEGLRLGVKTTGCSGYAYTVGVAESIGVDDKVYEVRGIKIVVDRNSLLYLVGTEVDYVKQGLNAEFKFNNPNVKATCGCGESFSV
ncbi:MAG: HesB/IscA family protein [Pseudomonadota bacterium]